MLRSTKPVVAVCAARTGCGKSQTSRRVGQLLMDAGLSVALVRHPMPYGDLEAMRVQRFATIEDIDASDPTVEEREEYETPVELGMVMYAGVDYGDILEQAQAEADVVIWDGGNNDLPFYAPDLHIVVVDPLRPGHELRTTPARRTSAWPISLSSTRWTRHIRRTSHALSRTSARSTLMPRSCGLPLRCPWKTAYRLLGKRVFVVEDGPTITHGGMPYGAGTVAARQAGATTLVDPRPYAVGAIAETFGKFPGSVGAAGDGLRGRTTPRARGDHQRADCDAVVTVRR